MKDTTIPQLVQPLTSHPVVDIAVGCEFVLALDNDHDLWSWGANAEGQLGLGNIDMQNIPCLVSATIDKNLNRVSAGW